MLLAVAIGDRQKFTRIWNWTQRNLQRDDGLLSWHWQNGQVDDDQPSADADLDAAHALALASYRFREPRLANESHRIASAARALETIKTAAGPVIAAGPWSVPQGLTNFSYTDPRALSVLARLGDSGSWERVAHASTQTIANAAGALPSDWATVTQDGTVTPRGAPSAKAAPEYSFDAVRVPIRFAASCSGNERALAARLWPQLRADPALLPRKLDGKPVERAKQSSAALAGAAAAATAAGKRRIGTKLLGEASAQERAKPTYFGSALVAITRATVVTPLLGRCT
jgi:endoglucanase